MALTREQAKEKLVSLGIEEPTDEQITKFLNDVHSEANEEKKKAEKLKADAERAKELEAELEKIKNQNLTEEEKRAKELEDYKTQIAQLQKDNIESEVKGIFSGAGLAAEEYDGYVNAFSLQDKETALNMAKALVQTIENAKETTRKKLEEELLDSTKGGGAGGGKEEKTEAEKIAEQIAGTQIGANKASNDILDAYTK